jgi:hypothetical protein
VDALAHAVQALQLERHAGRTRQRQHGGDGAGVVPGELRVDGIGHRQHRLGAGQVGQVGVVLVGEHRECGQAQLLARLIS